MNDLLVSGIITTKNSSSTLINCLESIKKQTYKNIEIILADNNSIDGTKEIAFKYTDKVYNKGPERSTQRNFGVSQSIGNYLLIIDSDMVLSEKVIESCVEKIQENENIKGIVIPEESYGEGFWARCKKLERSFYIGIDWIEAARFFEKNAFLKAGGFDESMVSGEDWDLSQRIEKEGKLGRISDYIFHDEQKLSLKKILKKKYYYSQSMINYKRKSYNYNYYKKQSSLLGRYKIFFTKPKKLLNHPFLSFGMIFMKTCEFAFGGVGYFIKKFKK